jgi:acetyl-CoA synthetase
MFDISTFPTADAVRRAAQLSQEDYQRLYRQSIEQPDTFWGEQAKGFLDWITPWHTVQHSDIHTGAAQWFAGGQLNVSYNCIDRHLAQRADQVAFIWEGDDPTTFAAWPMC